MQEAFTKCIVSALSSEHSLGKRLLQYSCVHEVQSSMEKVLFTFWRIKQRRNTSKHIVRAASQHLHSQTSDAKVQIKNSANMSNNLMCSRVCVLSTQFLQFTSCWTELKIISRKNGWERTHPRTSERAFLVHSIRWSCGSSQVTSYSKPIMFVRGKGQYLYDEEGNEYLDAYNNVQCGETDFISHPSRSCSGRGSESSIRSNAINQYKYTIPSLKSRHIREGIDIDSSGTSFRVFLRQFWFRSERFGGSIGNENFWIVESNIY